MAQPVAAARRPSPVIWVAGGAVVVLLAAWFLFLRPKEEAAAPTTTRAPRSTTTTRASEAPAAPDSTQPGGEVQEAFQTFEVKNPFVPLVTEGGGDGGTESAGAPTPASGETAPAPEPGTEAPSVGPGEGTASGGAVEPNRGTRVAMLEAPFTENGVLVANIKVGSTVYKVKAGDSFATSFQVVSLDGSCGTFLFGDVRFNLCAGQEVLK